ncbi:MAG: peptidoglycan bridge formation glycyltransferase FemA/FemB family protein, partial [Candidatus Curtissbacteria bacterium]|nr:peptidoglycan bridge formation glycyltransferase FemA/FemB family protein [Candidatus Curtissbacteria bacterium]
MPYHCSHIKEPQRKEWENLVAQNPAGGFQQSFNWAKFKQFEKWDSYKIGLFQSASKTKQEKLIGGALVLQFSFSNGTDFLYIPQGPILNYDNEDELFWQWRALETAIHSIVNIQRSSKTTHLRIEPRLEKIPKWFLSGFKKAPVNLQPKYTQIIDLTPPEDQILAQMKQKGRYNINLAIKREVKVAHKPLTPNEVPNFYSLYSQTYKRNEFDGKPEAFFTSFAKAFTNDAKIYYATHENDLLASAMVVYFGKTATYLYGSSSNLKRQLMAPSAMHWQIIRDSKKAGYKNYDLWGINRSIEDTT